MYSQVHKYWDINTIITFLALYTTTMDFKWNDKWEAHMQTVVIPTPFTWFGCKYPQIKADSLQLKHILFVSFEIHCGGV